MCYISYTPRADKSRYRFISPRYYRGPLHPHQPPPPSDPQSRLFYPGPFSLPRLQQTYTSTLAADLMTLSYQHVPFGTPKLPTPPRLRSWDDSSPYFKNRPLRAPRGMPRLGLLHKPITFNNVPQLSGITASILVRKATENSAWTHVAGMALQAITGSRARVNLARKAATAGHRGNYSQKEGAPISVTVTMKGEDMWHFLSTMVSIVLPKIKDWKGITGKSGDRNGNLQIGLPPDIVGTWPEIAVNYDSYVFMKQRKKRHSMEGVLLTTMHSYPPDKIPGLDIVLHTTARNDRDARLLLSSLGLPMDGRHRTS